jgi:hypothetical protein
VEGREEKRSSGLKWPGSYLEREASRRSADDPVLELPAEATRADLLAVMQGHVLGEAELTGVYAPRP